MTIPFEGVPLHELGAARAPRRGAGYDGLWSAESTHFDGFTPLVVAAEHTERVRLVTGIVNVFTRGPALLAQTAAALPDASNGRFVLGLGASSNVIVERWNGIPFERPLSRWRRRSLPARGARRRARRRRVQARRSAGAAVPIVLAALREPMLRLAARSPTARSPTSCR